ncbi:MAG: hypothetical protein R3F56_01385 [Planctomycetota bacterium]
MWPRTLGTLASGCGLLAATLHPGDLAGQAPQLVADVRATLRPADSAPRDFTAAGGRVFFTARTQADGRELWRSDFTAAGTLHLTDLAPGPSEVPITQVTPLGGGVVFAAGQVRGPQELWVSDGTAAGTRRLFAFGQSIWILAGEASGSLLLMTTDALWRTDGTATGTVRIDAFHGVLGLTRRAAAFGSSWVFNSGLEVWRSDGTASGTQRLGRSAHILMQPVAVGNAAYYGSDGGIYRADATSSRLVVPTAAAVADFAALPGRVVFIEDGLLSAFDVANPQPVRLTSVTPSLLTPAGNSLYFVGNDAIHGAELWLSDGTAAGTRLAYDAVPGPQSARHDLLLPFGSDLLHAFTTPSGTSILARVSDVAPPFVLHVFGARVQAGAASGGLALFGADDGIAGEELWLTTGGLSTSLFADLAPGIVSESSWPNGFTAAAGSAFFAAYEDVHGRELWWTDGTAAGTRLVTDLSPGRASSDPRIYGWHAGLVYFSALAPTGPAMYVSDGTAAGTRVLLPRPAGLLQARLRPLDAGRAILALTASVFEDDSIWVTDGLAATHLADARPTSDQVRVGTRVFFAGRVARGKYELMVSDGTPAGTHQVLSLNGSEDARVAPVAALDDRVLFTAIDGGLNRLYVSDGTASGTQALMPFAGVWQALTVDGRTYMVEPPSSPSSAVWVTDGTAAGTLHVGDVEGDRVNLSTLDGRVLIGTPRGIWRTDGTAAGTVRLRDREALGEFVDADGRYAYWASLVPSGILRSDGTAAGTTLLPTPPFDFTSLCHAAGRVYFGADDLVHGSEPFVLDVGAAAQVLGLGCGVRAVVPELSGSVPVLGGTARLHLAALPATGVAALRLLLSAPAPIALPGTSCVTWGQWNGPTAQWTRPFQGGRLDELLPIPATRDLLDASILLEAVVGSASGLELSNGLFWRLGR